MTLKATTDILVLGEKRRCNAKSEFHSTSFQSSEPIPSLMSRDKVLLGLVCLSLARLCSRLSLLVEAEVSNPI